MTTRIRVAFYDNNGQITGIRSGDTDSVQVDIDATTFNTLTVGANVTATTHYIKDGVAVEYPVRPSNDYVWDNTSESWTITLAQAQTVKWQEIKFRRDQEEFGEVTFNGDVYDADADSQRRIQGAYTAATLDANISLEWTIADNSTVTLDQLGIFGLSAAVISHVNNVHVQARTIRDDINSANTIAEVEAISWDDY
jgi:hypothetical protein